MQRSDASLGGRVQQLMQPPTRCSSQARSYERISSDIVLSASVFRNTAICVSAFGGTGCCSGVSSVENGSSMKCQRARGALSAAACDASGVFGATSPFRGP
jgi:hypothetical protein